MRTSKAAGMTASDAYYALLARVKKTLLEGQRRIEEERVRTYWETGRDIRSHILKYERAEYGGEVVSRLSVDLHVSETVLHRCVQFAARYPRFPIVAGRRQFTWSHYRGLITIPDDKRRLMFEKAASEKGWNAEELAARLKEERGKSAAAARPTPTPFAPILLLASAQALVILTPAPTTMSS